MLGIVWTASARSYTTEAGTPATFCEVTFCPMTPLVSPNGDAAGYEMMSCRADAAPAVDLVKLLAMQGPSLCELDLLPMKFGKSMGIKLSAFEAKGRLADVIVDVKGIRPRPAGGPRPPSSGAAPAGV